MRMKLILINASQRYIRTRFPHIASLFQSFCTLPCLGKATNLDFVPIYQNFSRNAMVATKCNGLKKEGSADLSKNLMMRIDESNRKILFGRIQLENGTDS